MYTVQPLLLGYPSLLDTVCPLLLGRYLSVCYWVCVHQLLVTVCSCVIGWFMYTVNPLLQGILHYWIQSVHKCWVGICPYVIGFVSINFWLLSVCMLLGGLCLLSICYYLGILQYWIQSVHYWWVYFRMLLGLCLSIVGYCLSSCCWLVYVHALLVTSFLPLRSSLLVTSCPLLMALSIGYCVCAHQLLVTVGLFVVGGLFPYFTGYFLPVT